VPISPEKLATRKPGFNLDGSKRKVRNSPPIPKKRKVYGGFIDSRAAMADYPRGPKPVMPKITKPHANGRAGLYEPEFCDAVIEFMSQGYTLSAFAAEMRVNKLTLANWGHAHPEFLDAVRIAQLACQKWWEDQLHDVALKGTHTSGRVTAIVFGLKNRAREDWSDIQRHEISGPGGLPLSAREGIDVTLLSTEELITLERLATKALPAPDTEGSSGTEPL
jgi:hypothetical protein